MSFKGRLVVFDVNFWYCLSSFFLSSFCVSILCRIFPFIVVVAVVVNGSNFAERTDR